MDFHYTLCCHFCSEGRNTQFTMSLLGEIATMSRQNAGTIDFSHNKKDRPQRQTEIEEYELTKVEVK